MKLPAMKVSWRYQMAIAFALMTIIPFITFTYFLIAYVIPEIAMRENVFLVIVLNLVISLAGYVMVRKLVKSFLTFRQYIESVAEGSLSAKLSVLKGPEFSSISQSVNSILQQLYDDRERLKHFSQQLEKGIEERTVELQRVNQALQREVTEHRQTSEKLKQEEEELKRSYEELRSLSRHLLSLREEERARMARRIHDELGQMLTALGMEVSLIGKTLHADQKEPAERTKAMAAHIEEMITTVQGISMELRPAILDQLGLQPAIEWESQEFQRRSEIKVEIDMDADIAVDKNRSATLFRIFQELMTNVARHAHATRVKATLLKKAGKIVLEVQDNGRGITEEEISCGQSFGLMEIRERCFHWRGEVKVKGIPDQGTTITVSIPID